MSGSPRGFANEYQRMVTRIRAAVDELLPPDASLLVVGKGDRELASMGARSTEPFPQNEVGEYAGYHPADDRSAIDHLDALRSAGAEYLIFPSTAWWWLDHYRGFVAHLDRCGQLLSVPDDSCRIWSLSPEATARARSAASPGAPNGLGRADPALAPRAADAEGPPNDGISEQLGRFLRSLVEPGSIVLHARAPSDPDLVRALPDFDVRSVVIDPNLNGQMAAHVRSFASGAGAVLLVLSTGGGPSAVPGSVERAVDGSLPRIARRPHLCSLYELRPAGGASPSPTHAAEG